MSGASFDFKTKDYRVRDGKHFHFEKYKTSSGYKKPDEVTLDEWMQHISDKLGKLQYKLYAEHRRSLLIILQGMDSSGKDSAIKSIVDELNPQGVLVYSFKHPSELELKHDYLWRHYLKLPQQGQIVIFNRSHYENVLISKVHPRLLLAEIIPGIDSKKEIDHKFWKTRYEQINNFEKLITQTGTSVLKFFLHISKEEQRDRFLERIENKEKHWKFSSADIIERDYWDDYQQAYKDALKNTHTDYAPWYVIPADEKWFAKLLINRILLEKLEEMKPEFPPLPKEELEFMEKARRKLLKEKEKNDRLYEV
jgi:PPK2 family polyphosphate:nucleotide phosphotransferase